MRRPTRHDPDNRYGALAIVVSVVPRSGQAVRCAADSIYRNILVCILSVQDRQPLASSLIDRSGAGMVMRADLGDTLIKVLISRAPYALF